MIQGVSQMSQLLAQMDRMRQQADASGASSVLDAAIKPAVGVSQGVPSAPAVSFGQVLGHAIGNVNQLQTSANNMAQAFEMGDSKVDFTQVMVTMQKANVAFEGMTQVRNKFIDAYKEIMSMSI